VNIGLPSIFARQGNVMTAGRDADMVYISKKRKCRSEPKRIFYAQSGDSL
jgi:hypothetical protein